MLFKVYYETEHRIIFESLIGADSEEEAIQILKEDNDFQIEIIEVNEFKGKGIFYDRIYI